MKDAVLEEFPDRLELSFWQSYDWAVDRSYGEIDIPVGAIVRVATFAPSKGFRLNCVALYMPKAEREVVLFAERENAEMVPLVEPGILTVCFPCMTLVPCMTLGEPLASKWNVLDLRGFHSGDFRWRISGSFESLETRPRLLIRHLLVKVYPLAKK